MCPTDTIHCLSVIERNELAVTLDVSILLLARFYETCPAWVELISLFVSSGTKFIAFYRIVRYFICLLALKRLVKTFNIEICRKNASLMVNSPIIKRFDVKINHHQRTPCFSVSPQVELQFYSIWCRQRCNMHRRFMPKRRSSFNFRVP